MATILDFQLSLSAAEPDFQSKAKTYNIDITTYPDNYLEFTVNNIRTDPKSLYKIADELEKIASIIRSDVITEVI